MDAGLLTPWATFSGDFLLSQTFAALRKPGEPGVSRFLAENESGVVSNSRGALSFRKHFGYLRR
jgi:hypothetical protein